MSGEMVKFAGEYKLEECTIKSSTGARARLDSSVIEINIFENIYSQGMIVSLIVTDLENLIMNLPIIGQEFVTLKLTTPGLGSIDYSENALVVHKVSARTDLTAGSQLYEINLISPESLRNQRLRLQQSFSGRVSDIVSEILQDEDGIDTRKDITIDETSENKKFVVANMRPLDFIVNLSKQCTSSKYDGSPNYFFYENTKGFQFRVIDSLYDDIPKGKFISNESEMNIETPNKSGNFQKDYERIKSYSFNPSNDTLLSTRGGLLSSRLIKYNIFNKNYTVHNFNYFNNFDETARIDKNPIYNKSPIDMTGNTVGDFNFARTQLHPTSNNDGQDGRYESTEYTDNQSEVCILPRRSKILELQNGLSMTIKVHGYCDLSVGHKVNITLPVVGNDHGGEKQIEEYYSGEFLITQLRHSFIQDTRNHNIIMNVVKDSTAFEYKNIFDSSEPRGKKGSLSII